MLRNLIHLDMRQAAAALRPTPAENILITQKATLENLFARFLTDGVAKELAITSYKVLLSVFVRLI